MVANLLAFVARWRDGAGGLADRALVRQAGQPGGHRTLLMATLGITYFMDGFGQTVFRQRHIYKIDIGMPKDPMFLFESCSRAACWSTRKTCSRGDRRRAGGAAAAACSSRRPSTGRALRAADDHQAAQSIGIPLNRIWVIVWCVAGLRGAGGRHHLGQQAGRAVLAVAGGPRRCRW